jgi:hypothetical protein
MYFPCPIAHIKFTKKPKMEPRVLLRIDFQDSLEEKPPGTIILGVLGHKPNGQSLKATEPKINGSNDLRRYRIIL